MVGVARMCTQVVAATFEGEVLNADGHAIPGARVWLYRSVYGASRETSLVAQVTTNAEGEFSVKDTEYEDLPQGTTWVLLAHKESWALDGLQSRWPVRGVQLRLLTPESRVGWVFDEDGKPLSNAAVAVVFVRSGYPSDPDRRDFVVPEELADVACA